jgi:hypothetical protein
MVRVENDSALIQAAVAEPGKRRNFSLDSCVGCVRYTNSAPNPADVVLWPVIADQLRPVVVRCIGICKCCCRDN